MSTAEERIPVLSAIIFDLDGVIIDSEFLTDKANAEFLRAHGKVYDRQEYKPKALGRTLIEGVIIMKELFGISGDPTALADDRRARIIKMYREQVHFVPGFLNFYQEVSRRGLSRCVATSADPALLAIVREQLSLDRLFPQGIFTIAEVGNRSKPDPAIYLLAAERLATDPACCLVIEDAPNGVLAAKRAGMRCAAITTTLQREYLEDADLVASSFSEIDLDAFL